MTKRRNRDSILNRPTENKTIDPETISISTADMWLWRLYEIAISCFEWTGLPEGIDVRQLEYWLMNYGAVLFFYDPMLISPKKHMSGYAVAQCIANGPFNMYNLPRDRSAFALDGYYKHFDESNSVIVFNNYMRTPMQPTLTLYAQRLALIDRTIDVNVYAQRTPVMIRTDDKTRLSMSHLWEAYDGFKPFIFSDKSMSESPVEAISTAAPFVSDQLMTLKHQYWNEVLTFLGIENTNTDKKERMITDEVSSNMGDVESQRFVRLNAREQACDLINNMFGLNVTCEFRSGMYIKTDEDGQEPDGTEEGEDGE